MILARFVFFWFFSLRNSPKYSFNIEIFLLKIVHRDSRSHRSSFCNKKKKRRSENSEKKGEIFINIRLRLCMWKPSHQRPLSRRCNFQWSPIVTGRKAAATQEREKRYWRWCEFSHLLALLSLVQLVLFMNNESPTTVWNNVRLNRGENEILSARCQDAVW